MPYKWFNKFCSGIKINQFKHGGSNIETVGFANIECKPEESKSMIISFAIVKTNSIQTVGLQTSIKLNLIKRLNEVQCKNKSSEDIQSVTPTPLT